MEHLPFSLCLQENCDAVANSNGNGARSTKEGGGLIVLGQGSLKLKRYDVMVDFMKKAVQNIEKSQGQAHKRRRAQTPVHFVHEVSGCTLRFMAERNVQISW
ncbi:hypothetical protein AMTR_s00008p00257470 [Amborella trichopoda]|uniref:Uncharacterized protein n=1 Tax=Amborella trichopoda TaxID=13333 RepID=W1NJP0_AMBTC|nr:hypothetical protein AMTR_s00008p00257470 [Amborella trichopoda]